MQHATREVVRRIKKTALVSLAAGMAYVSICSLTDVRHNLIAGTQAFIKGYATDLWEVLVPPPADLVGTADGA